MGLQLELTGGVFLILVTARKKKNKSIIYVHNLLWDTKSPPLCENLQKQAKIIKNRGN